MSQYDNNAPNQQPLRSGLEPFLAQRERRKKINPLDPKHPTGGSNVSGQPPVDPDVIDAETPFPYIIAASDLVEINLGSIDATHYLYYARYTTGSSPNLHAELGILSIGRNANSPVEANVGRVIITEIPTPLEMTFAASIDTGDLVLTIENVHGSQEISIVLNLMGAAKL